MAFFILPSIVPDEAAERRTRTEGLLRRLRIQADISQAHRRVASEAMAERRTKETSPRTPRERTKG